MAAPEIIDISSDNSSQGDTFKIPVEKCRCPSGKIIKFGTKSSENSALEVFLNQNSHLNAFSILKSSTKVGDFNIIHSLLSEMTTIDKEKSKPDPKFSPLAKGFIETFLRVHPPCQHHTVEEYQKLLEEGDRFSKLFKEMAFQTELVSKKVLPESSSRKKERRVYSEDSTSCAGIVKALQAIEESTTKKFGDLRPAEKLSYLFSAFSVIVKILEKDFEIWKEVESSGSTSSKSYRPLIMHLLWKDVLRFDRDAICNKLCLDIFNFFNNCLHNNASPLELKAVARLINIIAEVVELISRRQDGFTGGTAIGNLCEEFAKSFATSLGRCTCKDAKECLVLEKALIFIKRPWLLHLTTCCLLKQDSDISALMSTVRGALAGEEDITTQKHRLRSVLFSSAVDTFQMLGFRTSGPRRDLKRASKRIKLDQSAVKNVDDVEEIFSLIKKTQMTQMVKSV